MNLNLDRICRNVMIKIHNDKLPTEQDYIDRALKVAGLTKKEYKNG